MAPEPVPRSSSGRVEPPLSSVAHMTHCLPLTPPFPPLIFLSGATTALTFWTRPRPLLTRVGGGGQKLIFFFFPSMWQVAADLLVSWSLTHLLIQEVTAM